MITDLLKEALLKGASDLHISAGSPPVMRINGELINNGRSVLCARDTEELCRELLTDKQQQVLCNNGQVDFSYSKEELGRFRVNAYKQRGSSSLCIRVIASSIPTMDRLGLPPIVQDFAMKKRGMILVTGPTGSGKTTTLASIIDYINENRSSHILTLEDPIEYLHNNKRSMVNQREIGADANSYAEALKAALRQDPDVILVGEMRDLDTIRIAITAAETGHMVISTLHTIGAAKTIDRIIDVFPPHQQQQIRIQLSTVLEGIISQQLIPNYDDTGRVAAFEIMTSTPAIKNLIREGKTHQVQSNIQTGLKSGMRTMDYSIGHLHQQGLITRESALEFAVDQDLINRYMV